MKITHRWQLQWEKPVEKALKRLSSEDRMRVFNSLETLLQAENPCAILGVEKLRSGTCTWKFRQGDYRVFFSIESVSFRIYKGTLIVTDVSYQHNGY